MSEWITDEEMKSVWEGEHAQIKQGCPHNITLCDKDGIRCVTCGERIAWTIHDAEYNDAAQLQPRRPLAKADPQSEIAALRLEVERLKMREQSLRDALMYVDCQLMEIDTSACTIRDGVRIDRCTTKIAETLRVVSHE